MKLDRVKGFVDYMSMREERRITHPSGAEIFLADGYKNYDHEFKEPHYQTWFHVSFGEDKPYVGRKLFFRFGEGVPLETRLKAAETAANGLIDKVLEEAGIATGA